MPANTLSDQSPNLGWLFYKDYYFHEKARDNRVFYTDYLQELKAKLQNAQDEVSKLKRLLYQTDEQDKPPVREQLDHAELLVKDFKKNIDGFFERKNERMTTRRLEEYRQSAALLQTADSNLPDALTVAYPGLISGTGINHETGSLGEIKIGFAFDFTTGLPYLPGSGVKGVLRSAFPQKYNTQLQDEHPNFAADRLAFLQHYFQYANIDLIGKAREWLINLDIQDFTPEFGQAVDLLEMSVFHNMSPVGVQESGSFTYAPMPTRHRNVFFDAFIRADTYNGLFLATDFITPHLNRKPGKEHLSPFTEPVPIAFLKVREGVELQFQWRLTNGILTVEEKNDLFTTILTTFGIGAKTNVGYGQLI